MVKRHPFEANYNTVSSVKMKIFSSCCSLLSILVLVLNFESSLSQNYIECEDGQFYSRSSGVCETCSKNCLGGRVKTPCRKDSDLECEQTIVLSPEDYQESNVLISFEESSLNLVDNEESFTDHVPMPMERDDQEYWKALAFALIGLLCILIVATVAVLIACFRLQRAVSLKQQEEVEIVDTDSDYVVIRSIRSGSDPRPSHLDMDFGNDLASSSMLLEPTSDYGGSDSMTDTHHLRAQPDNKLCFLPKVYNPQRRLINYDADDVFESEDSAGSVRYPSLPRLKTIPERSDLNYNSKENNLHHHAI